MKEQFGTIHLQEADSAKSSASRDGNSSDRGTLKVPLEFRSDWDVELTGALGWLARTLGVNSRGKRRAENTMKGFAVLLLVNLFFDLGAWGLLFNAIFGGGGGSFEWGVHTLFALFAATLISLPILVYELQFMTTDLSVSWRRLILPAGLRLLVIFVAALITTQPVELMFFKGPIERRVHEESVRLQALTQLKRWTDMQARSEGKISQYIIDDRDQTRDTYANTEIQLRALEARQKRLREDAQRERGRSSRFSEQEAVQRRQGNYDRAATLDAAAKRASGRAQNFETAAANLQEDINKQVGKIDVTKKRAEDAGKKYEDEVNQAKLERDKIIAWLQAIRAQQPGEPFADPVRFSSWKYEDRSYDFFEQLRVLSDMRTGRPARWPEASEEDRQLLSENFKFKEREVESQEAQFDKTFYTWAYWAVIGIAFVIPALLLAFKLLQPEELRRYYESQRPEERFKKPRR